LLRNLLTAIAAVAIIVVAGAVYFMNRDGPSSGTDVAAPAPSATTAANTPPDAGAQPASPSASGTDTSTASPNAAPSTTTEPTAPSATQQVAVVPPSDIGADEHVLGKADAPVTIIEYASMTCPHCARWDADVMPRVKSEFIDKGLVRFVFRPFPLDGLALRASALAQCVPGEGYFGMVDVLFRSQNDWARASDPLVALKQIGRTAGLSSADVDRCIADEAVLNRLVASSKEANAKFGIDSTPSFVINGKKYTNIPSFDDYEEEGSTKPGFGKVIKDLLPKS
jgi:protein-disulfide isomerase